jgi:protein-tyrosine-phosphatase
MTQPRTIIFVCEHGAAKSVIAAAHFNRLASQMGLDMRSVARGTYPDEELSPQTLKGLAEEGLTPTELVPQKLTVAELRSAQRVITFCDLPAEYPQQMPSERWEDVPPVSESYKTARDAIVEHIHQMLSR